jgi:hypothetical protein
MTTDERRPTIDSESRRAAIIHDLRTRLAPVCEGWPPELFTSMVEGFTDISLRYEGRATSGMYDRRTTDRLVADMKAALGRNLAVRSGREPEG